MLTGQDVTTVSEKKKIKATVIFRYFLRAMEKEEREKKSISSSFQSRGLIIRPQAVHAIWDQLQRKGDSREALREILNRIELDMEMRGGEFI